MRRLVVPVFIAVSFFLAGCMADSKESTEGQSVQTTEARKELPVQAWGPWCDPWNQYLKSLAW